MEAYDKGENLHSDNISIAEAMENIMEIVGVSTPISAAVSAVSEKNKKKEQDQSSSFPVSPLNTNRSHQGSKKRAAHVFADHGCDPSSESFVSSANKRPNNSIPDHLLGLTKNRYSPDNEGSFLVTIERVPDSSDNCEATSVGKYKLARRLFGWTSTKD